MTVISATHRRFRQGNLSLAVADDLASKAIGSDLGNVSGTVALDFSAKGSKNYAMTLVNATTFTFGAPQAGEAIKLILLLRQDATGTRLVTWPTIRWAGGAAPTLTTTASKADIIELLTFDGAVTIFGRVWGANA